jgi:Uma2 family endonuclease
MVTSPPKIEYPDSDGLPMSDNTRQFRWIVYIKEGLEWLFVDEPEVFVAGDLLWYPVEGDNRARQAPDVLVAFGRPKGDRGSYRQWEEGGQAPQVVFEVLSPGNTPMEMTRKFAFYERFGVEEYYIYDPDRGGLDGYIRQDSLLEEVEEMQGWISPRMGVRFVLHESGDLELIRPDGQAFETYEKLARRAEQERLRAEQERERAEQERERAERLAARLRELGINPEEI